MVPTSAPQRSSRGYVVQNYPDYAYTDLYNTARHHQHFSQSPSVYYNQGYVYSPEDRPRIQQMITPTYGPNPVYRYA